jgi:hypothetical protein
LDGLPDLDAKPRVASISHVGADHTTRDHSLMGLTPRYTPRADASAKLDETLSGELVQVEL